MEKSKKKVSKKLIKMERNGQKSDVHPDEVNNYVKTGWVEVK